MSPDNTSDAGGTATKQRSTQEVIVTELTSVLRPLVDAVDLAANGQPDALLYLFGEMGLGQEILGDQFEPITETLEGLGDDWSTIESAVIDPLENGESPDLTQIGDVVGAIAGIVEAVKELDDIELEAVDVDALGENVVEYLLIDHLERNRPTVHDTLVVLGIVDPDTVPPDLQLSKVPTMLSDPNALATEALGWSTEDFDALLMLEYLHGLLGCRGIPVALDPSDVAADLAEAAAEEVPATYELSVPVFVFETEDGTASAGVSVVHVPGKDPRLPGLALVPFGELAVEESVELSERWTFNASLSAETTDWGMAAQPTTSGGVDIGLRSLGESSAPASVDGEAGIEFDASSGESGETTLVGDPEASRLALKSVSVTAELHYADGELLVKVALPATGTIGVHPDSFDGFLQKVLPSDGIFYDFDIVVGWSSQSGLFFERGGTLEVSLPQNANLGPVSMKEIFVRAGPDSAGAGGGGQSGGGGSQSGGGGVDASADASASGDVTVEEGQILVQGAVSGGVTLGPFSATIKRIGVEASVGFPENKDGNMGAVDLDVGFKPPEGIGLAIEGGPVSGGGYLEFDPENERYAGVLDLKIGNLSLTAVGLLTTEMPDGSDGFSLLVLICAEFPPVQLGFGLTLNGVGGLLGVNRSVKADPLGKAVRAGSLDSVLFPQNPVANAQRIISDLRSIFPPTTATHVFGPMIRIGWGTPTLITGDVGVVLEIPTWKVVLLGRLSAVLPDEEAALIELNLAIAGVLDPPNKSLRIDASLYDSRVVAWTLYGDMALRSSWGDDPRFLLSVGGFNPRYEPPKDFPELRRVTASLGAPGGNPAITLKGYFALTSNTVQAGAHARLKAVAGPAKVKGHLGFDALVQFNPFKFVVDILAALSVTIKGKGLSLKLDGTLAGPSPWKVKGKLHIEILFIDITVRVNATIGSEKGKEELPRAKVFPKVVAEFEKPGNWAAQLPESQGAIAAFRDVEAGDDEVLAHPLGELSVRQTVAPLGTDIEKFGNAKPSGHTRFDVAGAETAGGAAVDLATGVKENFAPAQFEQMSDSEKMNSPAFEKHPAGRGMRHGGVYPGYEQAAGTGENTEKGNTRTTTTGYESSVVDKTKDQWATPLADLGRFGMGEADPYVGLPLSQSLSLAAVGNVARADWKRQGNRRFALDDAEREVLVAEQSGVAATLAAESSIEHTVTTPKGGGQRSSGPDATDRATPGGDAAGGAGSAGVGSIGGRSGSGGSGGGSAGVPSGGSLLGGDSGGGAGEDVEYTVVEAGTLREASLGGSGLSKSEARRTLKRHEEGNPGDSGRFRVVERRKARGTDDREDGERLRAPGSLLGDGGETR